MATSLAGAFFPHMKTRLFGAEGLADEQIGAHQNILDKLLIRCKQTTMKIPEPQ